MICYHLDQITSDIMVTAKVPKMELCDCLVFNFGLNSILPEWKWTEFKACSVFVEDCAAIQDNPALQGSIRPINVRSLRLYHHFLIVYKYIIY